MATPPSEVRRIFNAATAAGVEDLEYIIRSSSPGDVRQTLMVTAPVVLSHYTEGTAALAAEWYDELRAEAPTRRRFRAAPVVNLDEARTRRTILWATQPLADGHEDGLLATITRLSPRAREAIGHGFWDTIEEQAKRDVEAVGWRRETRGNACDFCRMLAENGAVYRKETANFAAHKNCHCVAVPVFKGGESGPEASALQYRASSRNRSDADRAALRKYLLENYGDN